MKKYIVLYNGPASDMDDMPSEKADEVMEAWKNWMGKVGDALLDVGQPMANGVAIVDDGSDGQATILSGYSLLQANDIEEAKKLLADHPFLSEGRGNFKIEIHELMPVPM